MKFDIATINKAIDKYGVTIQQSIVVAEECGELIQQLAKMARGIVDEDALIEEVLKV